MGESGTDNRQIRIDRGRIRTTVNIVEMDNPERSRVLLCMERDDPRKAGELVKAESYLDRASAMRLCESIGIAIARLWGTAE